MISQAKRAERENVSQWTWRFTKAIDASGYYIRATAQDGTDYPIAITCGHGNDLHAAHLCRAANCHAELLAACKNLVRRIERDNLHTTQPGWNIQTVRDAIARAEGGQP